MAEPKTDRNGNAAMVLVLLDPRCGIDEAAVLELLEVCGIDPAGVEFRDPTATTDEEREADDRAVVVPICAANVDDADVDAAVRGFAQGGAPVTVVLGPGYDYEGLHPIARKYGGQCPWSAEELAPRLRSPEEPPLTGSGEAAPRKSARPVKC